MKFQHKFYIGAFVVAGALLVACGGGGGGSTPPTGGGGGAPSTAPSTGGVTGASPSAAASSSPIATQAAGKVVDYTTGAGLSGATVYVGSTLIYGATPPATTPAGDVKATTATDGTFTLASAPGTTSFGCVLPNPAAPTTSNGVVSTCTANVMVFTSDHITLHAPIVLGTGANSVGTLQVSTASANDTAWLAAINTDRANNGAGPVVLDERMMEAARLWIVYATSTTTGGDVIANAPAPYTQMATVLGSLGSYNVVTYENYTGGNSSSTGVTAEANFASEGPTGPHFSTIINPAQKWVGLGQGACSGACLTGGSGGYGYTEDLQTPPTGGV